MKGTENEKKGDKTPDKWLPKRSVCLYSRIYITTKAREHLTVTAPEVAALTKALGSC